jgi:hypothetical protein
MCGRYRRTTQEEELARLYPYPETDRLTNQLQHRAKSKGPDNSIQSENATAITRCLAMGVSTVLGQRSKDWI